MRLAREEMGDGGGWVRGRVSWYGRWRIRLVAFRDEGYVDVWIVVGNAVPLWNNLAIALCTSIQDPTVVAQSL